ncbi:MAG: M56 family metallopeptidase, partial [Clostridia bacterium]|nr:M56 family metallopeptidase [Clostridia bacterium]
KPISETAQMGNFEIVTAEQSGDFEEVITISSPPVSDDTLNAVTDPESYGVPNHRSETPTEEMNEFPTVLPEKSRTEIKLPSLRVFVIPIWLLGSVTVAVWFVILWTGKNSNLKNGRRLLAIEKGVRVYVSPNAKTPCVAGLFAAVYLPPNIAGSTEKKLILSHEIAHIKQLDPLWNVLRIAAVSVYWWNPLVWISAKLSAFDSEIACDDRVGRRLTSEERVAYAKFLFDFTRTVSPAVMGFGGGSLKERIRMLTNKPKKHVVLAIITIVLALIVGGCSLGGIGSATTSDLPLSDSVGLAEQTSAVSTAESVETASSVSSESETEAVSGGTEAPAPESDVSNYRFTALSNIVLSEDNSYGNNHPSVFSIPLSGGALAVVNTLDYFGDDSFFFEWERRQMTVLFDEQTKTMSPTCSAKKCNHQKNAGCFAYKLESDLGKCFCTVINDRILTVGAGASGSKTVRAAYRTLDGVADEKYEFDLSTLVRADGKYVKQPELTCKYAAYGNTVYIDVCEQKDSLSTATRDTGSYNRWLLAFDTETNEFRVVANYLFRYHPGHEIEFTEITDEYIVMCMEGFVDTKIDLKTGEYATDKCSVKSNGSASSSEFHEISYKGDTYVLTDSSYAGRVYYNSNGERTEILTVFEDRTLTLDLLIVESENGLIFTYFDRDNEGNIVYLTDDNGELDLYHYAEKWVYVTKEDYFDGQIDDPWYYDAETATFVQK